MSARLFPSLRLGDDTEFSFLFAYIFLFSEARLFFLHPLVASPIFFIPTSYPSDNIPMKSLMEPLSDHSPSESYDSFFFL